MLSALFALLFTSPALLSLPLPLLSLRNIGMKAFGPAVLAPPVPGPVEVGSRLHVAPAPHEEAAAVRGAGTSLLVVSLHDRSTRPLTITDPPVVRAALSRFPSL